MTIRYESMLLSELEREAYNTGNTLALAILDKLEHSTATEELNTKKIVTPYKGEAA